MADTIGNDVYISEVRTQTRLFWDAYLDLLSKQTQWNALDYGTELRAGTGDNEGITAVEVGAVLFDSVNAITTVLNTGVATNLAKML